MRAPPALQLAVIGVGTLVVPLDTTVNVAFPHIVTTFGIPMPAIQWVVICYVLVHASLMLLCGRLGDLFGYRRIFLAGCAVSALAFVLSSTAVSFAWLLGARAVQGVGAALVLSVGPALATRAFAEAHRTQVLGLYTMMFALGAAAGPMVAGPLIATWGWSAVYAFRVPLALAAFALAWLLPRSTPDGSRASFDLAGSILLVVAMGGGLLTLDQLQAGGTLWRMGSFAAVAIGASACFLRVERRVASPLIELRHFTDRRLVAALLAAIGVNFAGFSILLLGPFLLMLIAALTPEVTGMVLASSPFGMLLAAPLANRIAARIGMPALTGLGLIVTATGLACLGIGHNVLTIVVGMFVQGIGQGFFQVANFDLVTSALPARDRGVAGSLAMLTRTIGLVLGATLLMLVMRTLAGGDAAEAVIAGITGTYRIAAAIPLAMLVLSWWAGQRLTRPG